MAVDNLFIWMSGRRLKSGGYDHPPAPQSASLSPTLIVRHTSRINPSQFLHSLSRQGDEIFTHNSSTWLDYTPLNRVFVYLWAFPTTCLGLLFIPAALLTGGRVQVVDGVLEVYGGFVSFFLRHGTLLRGGASAMTLGHVVLGRDCTLLNLTRTHERIHVRQCERWGPFFIPAYLLASLMVLLQGKRPYEDNPFEREAYGR